MFYNCNRYTIITSMLSVGTGTVLYLFYKNNFFKKNNISKTDVTDENKEERNLEFSLQDVVRNLSESIKKIEEDVNKNTNDIKDNTTRLQVLEVKNPEFSFFNKNNNEN